MKKAIILFLFILLIFGSVCAQIKSRYISSGEAKNQYVQQHITNAEDEITISWLTSDNRVDGYGSGYSSVVGAFMEFYSTDLNNFNNTNKKIVSVKQVQFYIDDLTDLSTIDICKVVLMQGNDIETADEVTSKEVNIGVLSKGWNYVNLQDIYTINPEQNLYIGYQLKINKSEYPLAFASGNNEKQAWFCYNGYYYNISKTEVNKIFLIKALASCEETPTTDIDLSSINVKTDIISVFTNPVKNELNIQTQHPFSKIVLVNVLGHTIKEFEVKNGVESKLNVSDIPQGVYVLQLHTLNGLKTTKIQVK